MFEIEVINKIRSLYLDENLSNREIQGVMGISQAAMDKLIKENNWKKSKQQIQDCKRKTYLKRYGVDNPSKMVEVTEKIKETTLKNYGVSNASQSNEIKQKKMETTLKNYGVENPSQSSKIKERKKQTSLFNYGVEHPRQSEEMLAKYRSTSILKYGVDNPSKSHRSERTNQILGDEVSFKEYLLSIQFENRTTHNILADLEIGDSNLRNYLIKYNCQDLFNYYTNSSFELEFKKHLLEWGIEAYKTQSIIPGYEIDFYCPDFKIGIELNGNFYHALKPKNYHQKKSLAAKDRNIFIYQIYEYEWKDERKREIIFSQLRNLFNLNDKILYARKGEIREVSKVECLDFLNENHLQGNCNSSVRLGLFFNGELMSIMTFGKERFKKEDKGIELLRYCSKMGVNVIGGADKLFKHYIKAYDPPRITSFCDIGKGRGKIYETMGFRKEKICSPNYVWVKGNNIKTRYQCQMKNEVGEMEKLGYMRLYDCGNFKYVFTPYY